VHKAGALQTIDYKKTLKNAYGADLHGFPAGPVNADRERIT